MKLEDLFTHAPYYGSLQEAASRRYLQIFQGLFADPNAKATLLPVISQEIEWAQQTLKKDDRIVWYLRFFRAGVLGEYAEKNPNINDVYKKQLQQLATKSNSSPADIQAGIDYITKGRGKRELEHFISLPVADIQQLVFGWQTPPQLIAQMQKFEKEWADDRNRMIEPDEDAEIVIDFGDGYAWWDLQKAHCGREADAMGHCGNSPRSHTSDTILSLRKSIKTAKGIFHAPALTFILRGDGFLTEMKGRGNDKPTERYHKYIVPLLRHPSIKGIIGGGYMPENNFSIKDLPSDTQEELADEKPMLAGLWEIYKKDGKTDLVMEMMEELLSSHNITPPEILPIEEDSNTVIIQQYSDLEHFVLYDAYDKPTESLVKALDDFEGIEEFEIGREDFIEVLRNLPERERNIIFKEFNLEDEKDVNDAIDKAIDLMLRQNHRFVEYIRNAIMGSFDPEEIKQKLKDRLYDYVIDVGYPMRVHYVWLNIEWNEENPLNSPMDLRINFDDLIAIADEADSEDSEHGYAAYDIREYGWGGIDNEYLGEARSDGRQKPKTEEPLEEEDKADIYAEQFPGRVDAYAAAQKFAQRLYAPTGREPTSPEQPELPFAAESILLHLFRHS